MKSEYVYRKPDGSPYTESDFPQEMLDVCRIWQRGMAGEPVTAKDLLPIAAAARKGDESMVQLCCDVLAVDLDIEPTERLYEHRRNMHGLMKAAYELLDRQ